MKEREYLKELGKKITDSSVRKEIVNEYEAHIEDCKAAGGPYPGSGPDLCGLRYGGAGGFGAGGPPDGRSAGSR